MSALVACLRCGATPAPRARFCHLCGHAVDAADVDAAGVRAGEPDLVARTTPGHASQSNGESPAASGERRFATCLFADISGYTAICNAYDPERVHAMLRDFFAAGDRLIAAAGGHVIDHAGDGIVAVFGAPIAFGDDAARAVRAAQALHGVAATLEDPRGGPLRLHAGCASGDVVASTIGVAGRAKYTVTGDTMNLAARLATVARAGETVVSDDCYRAASRVVQAAALGALRLKGFDGPRTAWRIERVHEKASGRTPFVGREAELAEFDRVLDACRSRGRGSVVRVEGEAGIGKSRLLVEVLERAHAAGYASHTTGFVDFGAGAQRTAVGALLQSLLPAALEDDPRGSADWLRDTLAGAGAHGPDSGDGDTDSTGALVDRLVLSAELGVPMSDAQRATLGSVPYRQRLDAALRAIVSLACRLATLQPRLIVVEDLHWAPAPVADLLMRFAARAARARCVCVFASREPLDEGLGRAARAREPDGAAHPLVLQLAPLAPEEAARLAAGLAPDDPRVEDCVRRAGGNPLFLESLLQAMLAGDAREIPGSVHGAVSSRVDRLDAGARSVLLAASVFGVRFDVRTLEALVAADGTAGPLEPVVDALCRARLLQRDGSELDFAHALVREAAYASLLSSRRRDLHYRAAVLCAEAQPEIRAEHLLRAADPQAGRAFLDAASKALREQRPDAAVALAVRGIASRPEADVRTRLMIVQGDALREMGRSHEAAQVLDAALAQDVDATLLDRARLALVEVQRVTGEYGKGLALLEEAERGARLRHETVEIGRILNLRGSLMFARGRARDCLEAHREALDAARAAGDDEGVVRALSGLGDARYAIGEIASAAEHFGQALELARSSGMPRLALPAAALLGRSRSLELRLDEARDLLEGARVEAAHAGLLHAELVSTAMLVSVLEMRDENRLAAEFAVRGLELARAVGARRFEMILLRSSGALARDMGDRPRAIGLLRESLAMARSIGVEFLGPIIFAGLASTTDDAAEREAALSQGEAILADADMAYSHIFFRREAIEVCLLARNWQGARRHTELLEARFRDTPLAYVDLVLRRARLLCRLAEEGAAARSPEQASAIEQLRADIEACGYRSLLGRAMAGQVAREPLAPRPQGRSRAASRQRGIRRQ